MIIFKEFDNYKDYGRVLSISNGIVESYVTLDVGPRIIRFAFVGGQNILQANRTSFDIQTNDEYEKYFGIGKVWENLGGHRIWAAPEVFPQTLYPDLDVVNYKLIDNTAIFTPPPENENGLQKQLIINMLDDSADMSVSMRITNISNSKKEHSVWGITTCETGGKLIIPMNTNDTKRLPNRTVTIWPYTDMSDERIVWNKKYVVLIQKTSYNDIKLGFDLNCGVVYYVLGEDVFIKKYETKHPFAKYPHGNCSFETYVSSNFIEIESMGELKSINPNESLEFTERWSIKKSTTVFDYTNDDSIESFIQSI